MSGGCDLYFGIPHPNREQLLNDLDEYLGLNYIYVMNNFFIEKLDIADINILKDCLNREKIEISNYLLDLIKRTYKDIIKDNYRNGNYFDNGYKLCCGVAISENFVDNNALIFKIFYSKNAKELSDKDFVENMKKQNELLNMIRDKIIGDVKNTLDIGCNILIEKISN